MALVEPGAVIGEDTSIDAYAIVRSGAHVGQNCKIHPHTLIESGARIGNQVEVYPFACIGGRPQHLKHHGRDALALVGDRTILREGVTIHVGTDLGSNTTIIGNDCYLMVGCHVAHDCILGHHVIMANHVHLAGHVQVGNHTTIGGLTAVVQHCHIGPSCYIGGASIIRKDLAPFLAGKGNPFHVQGINVIGLRRQNINEEHIRLLRHAFRAVFKGGKTLKEALMEMEALTACDELHVFRDFIRQSKLGLER